jgi:predicted site-specific integrase-resolvase
MSLILTTDEAAEVAGVTAAVLRQWVVRGDLNPVRRGAKPLRFEYDEVARVQREKRPARWVARHAESVAQWEACCASADSVSQ